MQFLAIIALSTLTCIAYGIVHDQITARICVDYFTIGHVPRFGTEDPTILGFGWGVVATWWVGVMLGVPLACAARLGRSPKRNARSLVRPLLYVIAGTAICALIAGIVGYIAATNGWVQLGGIIAERVPRERHVRFLTDAFSHNASYAGGFLGGFTLIMSVLLSRREKWSWARLAR